MHTHLPSTIKDSTFLLCFYFSVATTTAPPHSRLAAAILGHSRAHTISITRTPGP